MDVELSPRAAEIVACTRQLLAVGGYNGFSYADISEALHLSKASIHHHFATKADLVHTVVRRYRAEGLEGVAALEQRIPEPLGQLKAYTGYWEACIRDGTRSLCVCAMLAAELPAIPNQVADEVRGHFQDLAGWLASVLKKGAAQGAFALRGTPKSEAMSLMATVHGAMLSARAYGDPKLFSSIVQAGMAHLLRGA